MDNQFVTIKEQIQKDILLEPYRYLSEFPGKEVRSRLIASFDAWLAIGPEKMSEIKQIIQLLHNASLLIDDIEDYSKLRRGVPVAHAIYGIPSCLNCGNYVYFLAMDACNKLGDPAALSVFLEELLHLHRGQGFDIYWRDSNTCPTEEEYKSMVLAKTGGLFRLAVRLMQIFSKNKQDFVPLLNNLGLFFQIRDDYLNLQSEVYMANKSFCEDLTEGKFSFPIIHAIQANPADHRLLNILKQRTENMEVKTHAVEFMKRTGSFEYTKRVIEEYRNSVMEEIEKLGGNPALATLVNELANSSR